MTVTHPVKRAARKVTRKPPLKQLFNENYSTTPIFDSVVARHPEIEIGEHEE